MSKHKHTRERERERQTYPRDVAVVEEVLHHHEVLLDGLAAAAAVVDRVHAHGLGDGGRHAIVPSLGDILVS